MATADLEGEKKRGEDVTARLLDLAIVSPALTRLISCLQDRIFEPAAPAETVSKLCQQVNGSSTSSLDLYPSGGVFSSGR